MFLIKIAFAKNTHRNVIRISHNNLNNVYGAVYKYVFREI